MRKIALILAIAGVSACGQQTEYEQVSELESSKEEASYAIGYRSGEQMPHDAEQLHLEAFIAGLRHGAKRQQEGLLMEPADMDDAIMAWQQQQMGAGRDSGGQDAEANREQGAQYREQNAEREEVTVLDNGIQYEVLESGPEDAASPGAEDRVVAHYHGTLVDGTVFDSSVERGEPATFPLNQVIDGWQEIVPMMRVGDKWRVVIPPELAYGSQGAGGTIGPEATLVFEVELLDIETQ